MEGIGVRKEGLFDWATAGGNERGKMETTEDPASIVYVTR